MTHALQYRCPSCGADVLEPCAVPDGVFHEMRWREAEAADWRALFAEMPEMPRHEQDRLFAPVDVMAGQLGMGL